MIAAPRTRMSTARVAIENGHQTVHLPAECRIDAEEVSVKRVGRSLLLIPADTDPWRLLVESLGQFTDDFMQDRAQPSQQERGPVFD
jgi:antitoxin VapB